MFYGCSSTPQKPTGDIIEDNTTENDDNNNNDNDVDDNNEQGLNFYLLSDGNYAVSIGNARYLNTIEFPASYKSKPVTRIVSDEIDYSYNNNNAYANIKEIKIPRGIKEIDNYSFVSCSGLIKISIADSVTKIGDFAFAGCLSLVQITIPDSVISICSRAFCDCVNLKTITISDNLKYIGSECFIFCDNLTTTQSNWAQYIGSTTNPYFLLYEISNKNLATYTINSECRIIYSSAFRLCSNLTDITIPKNITQIMDFAFAECSSLINVTFENDSSLKMIDKYCFYACSALEKINLPNAITSISNYAFEYCAKLNIQLPTSINAINEGTFSNCYDLRIILSNNIEHICANNFNSEGTFGVGLNIEKHKANIFFTGTQNEWENITIATEGNSKYNLYFYSATQAAGCWHYDADNITPILW
ncbi:MAG: leucine-rich repeat domain-containing protein [Clostridia bacterium]|nr:leucine-rich repeat domain-containing protein [Clostridia bacterium]